MKYAYPNLFVIGAPKSGTTALVSAIGQHPEIFIPKKKEPRYFDAPTFYDYEEDYPVKSLEDYLSFYKSSKAKNASYLVDGSVFNMYSAESIKNILDLSPQARFIVILRDPLTASKSMHAQRLKAPTGARREISEDFCACWKALEKRKAGKMYPENCRQKFLFRYDLLYSYELYIPEILKIIPSGRIYIGKYEKFKNDPETVYREIFSFLGVKNDFLPELKKMNPSYITQPSLFGNLAYFLSRKSFGIRKKLGLYGHRLNVSKKIFYKKQYVKGYKESPCDGEVSAFFQNTYKFLANLEQTSKHN